MINIKSFSIIDSHKVKGNIHIVGCGALGSMAAENLIRLNLASKIIAYDFDVVEDKNLNNQAYFKQHVGMNKVDALKDLANTIDEDATIRTKNKKVEYIRTSSDDVVILSLDNYPSRASILRNIEGYPLVIIGGANPSGGNVEVFRGDYDKVAKEYEDLGDAPEYDPDELTTCGSPISVYPRLRGVATIMAEQVIKHQDKTDMFYNNFMLDVPFSLLVRE